MLVPSLVLLLATLQGPTLPPEAREWFVRGEDLIGTDREFTEEQAGYFEKVLELAPGFAPAHFNLALIYLEMERLDSARIHAEALIELLPADPRGYRLRAHIGLVQQRPPEELEPDLRTIVELAPDDGPAWADLARLYYDSARYREAIEAAARAREQGAPAEDVLLMTALSEHGLGEIEKAEGSYRQLLQLRPDDFTALFNLGIIYRGLGRDEDALSCFQKAERIRPDDPRLAQELGELFLDLGRLDEARERLEESDSESAVNLSNLGVVARRQGDFEAARRFFEAALQLDPENASLWGHLGDVLAEAGSRPEALHAYQKALEYDPEDLDSLLNLGSMLANLEELSQARSLLQRALELQPESGDAAYRLAVVTDRLSRSDEAFRLYLKALELGHDEARLHFRLALHYSRRDQPEAALQHLEEAFIRDAENLIPIVREQLKAVRSDLDAIRYKPAFQDLMKRYSPPG